jgi:hypothetical protein
MPENHEPIMNELQAPLRGAVERVRAESVPEEAMGRSLEQARRLSMKDLRSTWTRHNVPAAGALGLAASLLIAILFWPRPHQEELALATDHSSAMSVDLHGDGNLNTLGAKVERADPLAETEWQNGTRFQSEGMSTAQQATKGVTIAKGTTRIQPEGHANGGMGFLERELNPAGPQDHFKLETEEAMKERVRARERDGFEAGKSMGMGSGNGNAFQHPERMIFPASPPFGEFPSSSAR